MNKKVAVVSVAEAEEAARLADLPLEATVALADVAGAIKDGLLAFASATGLVVMHQMMAAELTEALAREGASGFQVVIDYLWGAPTEAFVAAITRKEFAAVTSEIRLVQVGEIAGPTISLPAAALLPLQSDGSPDGDAIFKSLLADPLQLGPLIELAFQQGKALSVLKSFRAKANLIKAVAGTDN